jgi:hypothetical protein
MQIHELTYKSAPAVMEAGFLDYIKTLKTPPGMAGMSWDQRANAVARDAQVRDAALVALKDWQARTYQLAQVAGKKDPQTGRPITTATGAPVIDEREYQQQLLDFVDQKLLQGSYRYLDRISKTRVDAAMQAITASKDNPSNLQTEFLKLLPVTTTAIQTAQMSQPGTNPQTQATAAAGAQAGAQQLPREAQAVRDAWTNVTTQAGRDNFVKTLRATAARGGNRTGNPAIDDFLTNIVGIRLR